VLIDTEKWIFMWENLIGKKPFLLDKEQTFALIYSCNQYGGLVNKIN